MSKFKYQLSMDSVGDMKGYEQHFAEMARNGWMIDKMGRFFHRYRSIEPCEKQFFVDCVPKVAPSKYPQYDEGGEYRRKREENGWEFVTSHKSFNIFYADGLADTPEIQEISKYHYTIVQRFFQAGGKQEVISAICFILFCFTMFLNLRMVGYRVFLSNANIFWALGMIALAVGAAWTSFFHIVWNVRAMRADKRGLPMPKGIFWLAQLRKKVFLFCLVLAMALFVTSIVSVLPSGLSMRFVQNVDLGEQPVIRFADVGIDDAQSFMWNRVYDGSFLVPVNYFHSEVCAVYSPSRRTLSVHVYRTNNSWVARQIYSGLVNERLTSRRWHRVRRNAEIIRFDDETAALWGAQQGLMLHGGEQLIILRNGRTVLNIRVWGGSINTELAQQVVKELW